MKRAWIRSSLFNIAFIVVNAVCCFLWLPTLLLPRPLYMKAIDVYHYVIIAMEYYILGLRYQVIGAEHLPEDDAYIVAAKH
ncbi:MAG: 1-acyl-sn-glycerol-3-phosphate acyltransferase, partial [Pseudomonadota bacterium]